MTMAAMHLQGEMLVGEELVDQGLSAKMVATCLGVVRDHKVSGATAPIALVAAPLPLLAHRAQSGLIRRDREIRIFGNFSFFMHARIISHIDFRTIHQKMIPPKKGLFRCNDWIS